MRMCAKTIALLLLCASLASATSQGIAGQSSSSSVVSHTKSSATSTSVPASSSSLIFDVTAYGAVPDGRTDCTDAVFNATQALINATLSTTTAPFVAVLYFPAGTFLLNSQPPPQPTDPFPKQYPAFIDFTGIQTKQAFNLSVIGASVGQTTILVNISYAPFLSYVAVQPNPANSISLGNATINSVKYGQGGQVINLQGANDITLSNLNLNLNASFIGMANALNSLSVNQVNATISYPTYNALSTTALSVSLTSSSIVAQPPTSYYYCLYFSGNTNSVSIGDSTISNFQGVMYLPDSSSQTSLLVVDIINSQFNQFNTAVYALSTSTLAVTVSGCSFNTPDSVRGTTTAAIKLQSFGNGSSITITNNTFSGPYVAIQINSPISLVMDSNTIDTVSYGVLFLSDSGSPLLSPIDQSMKPFVITNNDFSNVRLGVGSFYQSLTTAALPGAWTFEGNECDGDSFVIIARCEDGFNCNFDKNEQCVVTDAPTLQIFDVTQYGAVGDGVTDCSKAVQAAAAAMMAQPNGGQLFFPQGTYLLNSPPTPCAPPGQGACAYVSVNVNSSFALPTARYQIAGDYNGGVSTILWRSDLGMVVQYFVELYGPSSAVEVVRLVIEAQHTSSPASSGYSALWASGNYVYVHDVNITGPVNSSVPLLYKQEGSGSSMLIENVNLFIDPQVGVGMLTTETSGIKLFNVQVDSLNGSIGDSNSKAFALLWNEYTANILIDTCTFLPGSRQIQMYGDNDGNPFGFLIRDSTFNGASLALNTELYVTVQNCSFNAGPGGAGGVLIGTDFLFENAYLTVTGTEFNNLNDGINSQWGRVTASQNVFNNCTIGVNYYESAQWTPISQPVVLHNNQFITTLSSQLGVLLGNGDAWIVTNNTCSGPAAPGMVLRCSTFCTQSNNVGCGTNDVARVKHAIVLSEQ